MFITIKRQTAHRIVNLPSVYHNEETNCAPRSQNQNLCLSLVAFKGTVRRNPFTGENIYHEIKDLKEILQEIYLKPKSISLTEQE